MPTCNGWATKMQISTAKHNNKRSGFVVFVGFKFSARSVLHVR